MDQYWEVVEMAGGVCVFAGELLVLVFARDQKHKAETVVDWRNSAITFAYGDLAEAA